MNSEGNCCWVLLINTANLKRISLIARFSSGALRNRPQFRFFFKVIPGSEAQWKQKSTTFKSLLQLLFTAMVRQLHLFPNFSPNQLQSCHYFTIPFAWSSYLERSEVVRENSDFQNKFIKQKLLWNDSLMRALRFVGLDEVKSCLNFAKIEKTTSGNIIQSLLNNSVKIFSLWLSYFVLATWPSCSKRWITISTG